MDRSGPGCRKADPDFTGELGCRAGHEGRHLFMPDLHEVDGAFCSIQCRHEAADAVSGIAEHPPHAPGVEAHPRKSATVWDMAISLAGGQRSSRSDVAV